LSSPDLQLEQPVARRVISLRKEEVVLVSGVDVGNAGPIPDDLTGARSPVTVSDSTGVWRSAIIKSSIARTYGGSSTLTIFSPQPTLL